MDFGNYISGRRKALQMSQKELAAKIKKVDGSPISPQYLNDIERNRRNPPSENLIQQIADILGISFEYLLFFQPNLMDGKFQTCHHTVQ